LFYCHFVSVWVRWVGGSFAIFGFSIGCCELQMCMAFSVGYLYKI